MKEALLQFKNKINEFEGEDEEEKQISREIPDYSNALVRAAE